MELLLSMLPLLYTKLLINRTETIILILHRILKFLLVLISCIVTPFAKLQFFKKRKKLSAIKSYLLLSSASEIARKIRRREISSEEVVRAYVDRCIDVNPIINAIVDSRFDLAIQEACEVDEYLACTTKTEKELARELPLLGVPITVKGSIAVKGMSYTSGLKKSAQCKATKDAVVVNTVRNAGAIILLVSNIPELCLFWETSNQIIGSTWNPYDNRKIAGGSSGGEAALVASAASVISISSDVAGSVRFPALFCGVFGHKPTSRLVPIEGHKPNGNDIIWTNSFVIGPIVRYAEDLSLMMKIISQSEEIRSRFDEKVSIKNLKFFYMEDYCTVLDSIDNDVRQAIKGVREHIETTYGLQVQKAYLSDMKFSFDIATHSLLEMDVPEIESSIKHSGSSKILLELLKCIFLVSPYMLPTIIYSILKLIFSKFPEKIKKKVKEKQISLKKQFEDLLGDNGILICPTFTSASYYSYQTYSKFANCTHLMIYNVLGLPATHCSMGLNKSGLPIGVQVVANAGNDHLTIAVAQEIERAFGGWQQPLMTKLDV
ncbi:PREDICTED: fatty-acid amide hydrolase 2-like isoform X1 [Eufriesea mexicana]|uniref:fatty-acid amide hydrolase 2-like isoform X1 n=1 Tax=Eufriesea mexicana TaxID=516756 RepID=UPI00083C7258|nr:PREDICTED: fatty-acid amide hydrolase 2-like isoform X1 [Eufriesea mexicana]XP_017762171.1 PREDICTED: fatty-acid amide hydrolase 2-like isoform X1 [Eufriesea mexicana]